MADDNYDASRRLGAEFNTSKFLKKTLEKLADGEWQFDGKDTITLCAVKKRGAAEIQTKVLENCNLRDALKFEAMPLGNGDSDDYVFRMSAAAAVAHFKGVVGHGLRILPAGDHDAADNILPARQVADILCALPWKEEGTSLQGSFVFNPKYLAQFKKVLMDNGVPDVKILPSASGNSAASIAHCILKVNKEQAQRFFDMFDVRKPAAEMQHMATQATSQEIDKEWRELQENDRTKKADFEGRLTPEDSSFMRILKIKDKGASSIEQEPPSR